MDSKPFRTTRHIANLRQGRNDWYRIKAQADGPALVHIYDEIGYFGVTSQDFIRDLAAVSGDIELHLNTPGGEVFDGIAIYGALKQRPGQVSVVVDSLAASIGSVIAMGASPGQLVMAKNATMMIHDGFGMGIGNAADMRELADLLDKTSDNIASVYAERTGQPAAQWREKMRAESWYVGQEAVDAGLAVFAKRPGQLFDAIPDGVKSQFLKDLKNDSPVDIASGMRRLSEWAASGHYPQGTTHEDLLWFYNQCAAELKSRNPESDAGGTPGVVRYVSRLSAAR